MVTADGPRLAFFDEVTRRWDRITKPLVGIGALAVLIGLLQELVLGPTVHLIWTPLAFLVLLLGYWLWLFRHYAHVRLWGAFENGVAAALIRHQSSSNPFVRWESVRRFRFFRAPRVSTAAKKAATSWAIVAENTRGRPCRIQQEDLERLFGYTPEESQGIGEALLSVARAKLRDDQIDVRIDEPK